MSDNGDEKQALKTDETTQQTTDATPVAAPADAKPDAEPVPAPAVIDVEPAPADNSATVTAPADKKPKKKLTLPKPNFTPKYYDDVEYKNRDEHNLHPDIRVNFSDVIAEPEGAHSFATIWGTSFKSYSVVKYWTYRILTAVLAVPISVFSLSAQSGVSFQLLKDSLFGLISLVKSGDYASEPSLIHSLNLLGYVSRIL